MSADYARQQGPACESKYEDYVGHRPTHGHPSRNSLLSTPGYTSMKEIIKGAIVIDPAFGSEMTLVKVKKSRVFVMSLKIN
jgi:hypothetical protein